MNDEHVTIRRTSASTVEPSTVNESVVDEKVTRTPSGATVLRRLVVFIFALIQLVIGLRIILLAINADQANALVAGIYNVTAPLVAPFEGILRTDALHAGGSVLDVAAIVALVGWTILELVILAAIRIGSRES